jgi:hypothetical protein
MARMGRSKSLPPKLHKELQHAGLIVGFDIVYKSSRRNEKERKQ